MQRIFSRLHIHINPHFLRLILEIVMIIGLIFGCIIVFIPSQLESPQRKVCFTIASLEKALELYRNEYGAYPPDDKDNGGEQEGTTYKYRNDVLVTYLGSSSSHKSLVKKQFFLFNKDMIINNTIYSDYFGGVFWYHNFEDDVPILHDKIVNHKYPLHPWENAIQFASFQIYSKGIQQGKDIKSAYYDSQIKENNFIWVTNYHGGYLLDIITQKKINISLYIFSGVIVIAAYLVLKRRKFNN